MKLESRFENYVNADQVTTSAMDFEISEVRNDSTHHNWYFI
ncbi:MULTISPECIES: hypothetical protein [Lactobacillus]|nr:MULTISPECIES: hypothetical protein [Lactobacillus]